MLSSTYSDKNSHRTLHVIPESSKLCTKTDVNWRVMSRMPNCLDCTIAFFRVSTTGCESGSPIVVSVLKVWLKTFLFVNNKFKTSSAFTSLPFAILMMPFKSRPKSFASELLERSDMSLTDLALTPMPVEEREIMRIATSRSSGILISCRQMPSNESWTFSGLLLSSCSRRATSSSLLLTSANLLLSSI